MSGPINLGIKWDPNFKTRTEAGFQRLQKEADGEFIRLVTPYVPLRTGALADSAKTSTVLGSGLIRHTTPCITGCPAGRACARTGAAPTGASGASTTTKRTLPPLSRRGPTR